jgi:hypothetical protein
VFRRVLNLVLSLAAKPQDNRCAEEVQEDTFHCLCTLKRFNAPPHTAGLVDPAIRLVCGEAWTLVWARIAIERNKARGECDPAALAELEGKISNYFNPNLEETNHVSNPRPTANSAK